MKEQAKSFEQIWWEMEEIEPLTPSTKRYYETDEVPPAIRQTEEEGLL